MPIVASALAWIGRAQRLAAHADRLAGSIVVVAAGAVWFVQRVFFVGGRSMMVGRWVILSVVVGIGALVRRSAP